MTAPKRILQVLGCLDRGGAETLVMNIYRNMDREQVQFDFVIHTKDKGAYYEEILSLGGKIYNCPQYTGKNHFTYTQWWKSFFEEHTEYATVHGHVRSTAAIYLKIAKKYHRFTVAHSHSTSSGKGISAIVKNIMQFPIRTTADYFLGCSQIANEWLFGKRVANDSNKCSVLKNGVDLTKYRFDVEIRNQYRKFLKIETNLVIGTVGRIETPKNPMFIIDVFCEILKTVPSARLLWVGDGSLMSTVNEKIAQLNIENKVLLVGSKNNVSDYLQAMDVFLFPSLWEGLGMSLIEAQATGLPCICSDVIPDEARVTDLMIKKCLTDTAEEWATVCLGASQKPREDQTDKIKSANYDIKQVVEQLKGVYGLCSNDANGIN